MVSFFFLKKSPVIFYRLNFYVYSFLLKMKRKYIYLPPVTNNFAEVEKSLLVSHLWSHCLVMKNFMQHYTLHIFFHSWLVMCSLFLYFLGGLNLTVLFSLVSLDHRYVNYNTETNHLYYRKLVSQKDGIGCFIKQKLTLIKINVVLAGI